MERNKSLEKLVDPLVKYFAEEMNTTYPAMRMMKELSFAFDCGDPSQHGRMNRFCANIGMTSEDCYLAFEAIDAFGVFSAAKKFLEGIPISYKAYGGVDSRKDERLKRHA
jgi:hypothetical protein